MMQAAMPLFSKKIVLTRDILGNVRFAEKIIRQGGRPVLFPTIKIVPLTEKSDFVRMLAKIKQYDWVVFTSQNGVNIFFNLLERLSKDARVFASAKIAAIGTETANALARSGIRADLVPDVFTGRELAAQLIAYTDIRGKKILLLRSRSASKDLPEMLTENQAIVDDVAVYDATPANPPTSRLKQKLAAGDIDWLTFASPSAARAFFELIEPHLVRKAGTSVASIGPVTSEQLKSLGLTVDVEAAEHTIDGLICAMVQASR